MIFGRETRTQAISREQVWQAWKRIRQGGQATGVDGLSIAVIASQPRKYLYPLWNRLSSGSYFPPAVREVEIPKGAGKTRKLGIPTILDRVAQEVIREELEGKTEPHFFTGFLRVSPPQERPSGVGAVCPELLGTVVCGRYRHQGLL